MKFSIPKANTNYPRRLLVAAVFGVALVGMPTFDVLATREKIYPRVRLAAVEIGGRPRPEARAILQSRVDSFLASSATFTLGSLQAAIPLRDIVAFDIDRAIATAEAVGNSGSSFEHAKDRLTARLKGIELPFPHIINVQVLEDTLHIVFQDLETPPRDAQFSFAFENNQPTVSVAAETAGSAIGIVQATEGVTKNASQLTNTPLALELEPVPAQLATADLEPLLSAAQELVSGDFKEIKKGEKHWTVPRATLASWIIAEKKDDGTTRLVLDEDGIIKWLDTIANDLEQKAVDASFEVSPDGKKATKFGVGTAGLELPRKENAILIARAILAGKSAELLVQEMKPRVKTAPGLAEYGIKELVGRGSTNFKGSPPNRIKNIKRGAAILQGALIAPGEEFSLLDHLRPFTLENGYLPELVIKAAERKTTPEIGGGLCQIGTTMFRTALNAGLPITERRNHSYRVSYYEPPVGMDATIYDPAPDFKFLNDTDYWLVLTTQVEGTTLTFELWGTKDGRQVALSEPAISNLKRPPEKKIIETTKLPPGTTKCTERAHIGSDAKFTYTVTYADGKVETKEFFSRYRPWQEVCLLGVAQLTTEAILSEPVPLSPDAASPATPSPADTLEPVADTGVAPPPQN